MYIPIRMIPSKWTCYTNAYNIMWLLECKTKSFYSCNHPSVLVVYIIQNYWSKKRPIILFMQRGRRPSCINVHYWTRPQAEFNNDLFMTRRSRVINNVLLFFSETNSDIIWRQNAILKAVSSIFHNTHAKHLALYRYSKGR